MKPLLVILALSLAASSPASSTDGKNKKAAANAREAERLRVLSQPAFQNNRTPQAHENKGAEPPHFVDPQKQELVDGQLGGVPSEGPREPAAVPGTAGQINQPVAATAPNAPTPAQAQVPDLAERAPASSGGIPWSIYGFLAFLGVGIFWVSRKKR